MPILLRCPFPEVLVEAILPLLFSQSSINKRTVPHCTIISRSKSPSLGLTSCFQSFKHQLSHVGMCTNDYAALCVLNHDEVCLKYAYVSMLPVLVLLVLQTICYSTSNHIYTCVLFCQGTQPLFGSPFGSPCPLFDSSVRASLRLSERHNVRQRAGLCAAVCCLLSIYCVSLWVSHQTDFGLAKVTKSSVSKNCV